MHPAPPIINIRNWDEAYSSQDIFYTHQSNLYTLGPCHAFCPASLILCLPFLIGSSSIESEHGTTIRIGNILLLYDDILLLHNNILLLHDDILLLHDSWEAGAEGWLEAIPGHTLNIHHKKCGEWREEHMRKEKKCLCWIFLFPCSFCSQGFRSELWLLLWIHSYLLSVTCDLLLWIHIFQNRKYDL